MKLLLCVLALLGAVGCGKQDDGFSLERNINSAYDDTLISINLPQDLTNIKP